MRRIERLLNLVIALVTTRRPYTAEDIRSRVAGYDQKTLEAFRRAFERDKEDLRNMGIPLEVVPRDAWSDVADAYIIPKEKYYLPELDLEPDELAALRLAADAVLGVRDHAAAAWLKVSVGEDPAPWGGPKVVWGADVPAVHPALAALSAALADRRPVKFDYESAAGSRSTRQLEPYSLVQRRGHWYVVGHDRDRDAPRSFKLSRIVSDVTPLEGRYVIPESFRVDEQLPAEAWEIGSETAERATLRFDSSMRWWAEHNLRDASSSEAPEGGLDVELEVANLDALVSWVIELGDAVQIVAPESARQHLLDHLAPFLQEAG